MAIAFGANLGFSLAGGVSTRSLTSLSISGSNKCILVAVRSETTSPTVSSLYFDNGSGGNQQAFTQLGTYKTAEGGNHKISLWYLLNADGANSRIIMTGSTTDTWGIWAAYYTGVASSSAFTTPSSGGPQTYSSQTQADTSDAAGSWHIGVIITGNAGLSITQGTARQQGNSGTSNGNLLDSNAPVASGSSDTFGWNGGSSTAWIMAMMRPLASSAPTVDTLAATDVVDTGATLNGEITDEGTDTPDERGFVWGTTSQSAPGDVAPASAGYDDYETETGTFVTGTFDYPLSGLTPSTTYYARAYAHSSVGYAYGDEISFTTEDVPPFRFTNLPGVEFDPDDTTTIYAERLNDILERLEALEG